MLLLSNPGGAPGDGSGIDSSRTEEPKYQKSEFKDFLVELKVQVGTRIGAIGTCLVPVDFSKEHL